ncbi:MAG: alpha-ketoglutarate-dependent dioxygenase AlkB [Chlamydiota bacterium]
MMINNSVMTKENHKDISDLHPELNATYYSDWYTDVEADQLMKELLFLPWETEEIKMFGKIITVPRKVLWVADEGVNYKNSGKEHYPKKWNRELSKIRKRLEKEISSFNSVLCNLYHDGRDYMGWHQDNEPELGQRPTIASLTFGAERKFQFRHRITKEKVEITLTHGSLLVMYGNSQDLWQHALPKMLRVKDPRINLTFRNIQI